MHGIKTSDFRMAMEEAFLVENGFAGAQLEVEMNVAGQKACHQFLPRGIQEAMDSNQDQECHAQSHASCFIAQIFPCCTFLLLAYFYFWC